MRSLYSSSKISKLLHSSSFYLQKFRIELTIFAKWLDWKSDYNSDQREIWSDPTVLSSLYFWTNVLDISFEYFRPKGIPIKDLNSGQKAFTFQRIIAFELISANLASIGWALLVLAPFTNHSDGHLNMNCSATEACLKDMKQSENTKIWYTRVLVPQLFFEVIFLYYEPVCAGKASIKIGNIGDI